MNDAERAAMTEIFRTLINLVKQHNDDVTRALLVNSALLQALTERFPEIQGPYERYLAAAEQDSPAARQARLTNARFEELFGRMLEAPPE